MYHAHFGLERGLFGEGIAADAAVFRSGKHDRLIAHFKLALASPSAVIVLHGPAGVGKTTLTATALRASSTRLALAWLNGMPTNAAELLELILVELGIATQRTTRIERLQLWRQFQGEMRATDSRLFIVAEGAEDLSPEILHALDQLTAPDATGNPGANLVLLGHAGLAEHLSNPLLDSLRQRIRLRAELDGFTEAELQDYLRHHVACAGGQYDRIFAPGAVAALFRYSKGVARLANTLCESALDIAAVQQHKQLTPELVARTAVSLLGLADLAPAMAARVDAAAPETRAAPAPVAPSAGPPRAVPGVAAAATPTGVAPAAVAPAPPAAPAANAWVAAAPAVSAPAPAAATRAPPVPQVSAPIPAAPAERRAETTAAAAAVPAQPLATPSAAAVSPAPPPAAPGVAAGAAARAPAKPLPAEFDGSATDVADVALADFPVLTDAVEAPAPAAAATPSVPAAAKLAAPAAAKTTAAPTPARPAPSPAPTQPPAQPVNRAEPPSPPRPAQKPPTAAPPTVTPAAPAPIPAARVASTKPAPPDPSADDALRQTQTMHAIAAAKSIDDISDTDAETLFADAELDLVSAALASAAEWPDEEDLVPVPALTPAQPEVAKAAPKAEPPKADPKATSKPNPATEDPFDLFGLGEDAPLELMDDATLPPASPARRTAIR